MKFSETKTKWVAIALFYMIAVVTRAVVLKLVTSLVIQKV